MCRRCGIRCHSWSVPALLASRCRQPRLKSTERQLQPFAAVDAQFAHCRICARDHRRTANHAAARRFVAIEHQDRPCNGMLGHNMILEPAGRGLEESYGPTTRISILAPRLPGPPDRQSAGSAVSRPAPSRNLVGVQSSQNDKRPLMLGRGALISSAGKPWLAPIVRQLLRMYRDRLHAALVGIANLCDSALVQ
jgi:hypothetical protein